MKPKKKNDAEDQPPVLKEEAIALAEPAPPVVDVAKKRRNTNIGVGIGVLLQVGGLFIAQMPGVGERFFAIDILAGIKGHNEFIILGLVLILVSLPPFIWGCMNYAAAKGYTKEVGLLGLLSIIGLNILVLLPDKLRDGPKARIPLRKIWMLVELVFGLGLVTVGSVLEDAAFQRGDINRGFEWSLIVLGLILITISLLTLLSNWKETQPEHADEDGT